MAPSPTTDDPTATPFLERTVVREVALVAVVAAIQIGLTSIVATHAEGRGSIAPAGYALLVIGVAGVPLRRWNPVVGLWVSFLATLAYWSLDFPPGPVFTALIVTLAYALLVGRRVAALVVVGVGYVCFPWLGVVLGQRESPPWVSMFVLAAWLVTLVAVIEAVRSRRDRMREAARSEAEVVRRQAADERLRIARELHDVVAHNMSLINVQAGVALHLMGDAPEPARDALIVIKDASKDALVELRSILGVLRQVDEEVPHRPAPSLDHLDELIERSEAAGVRVRLDDPGRRDGRPSLPRDVDLAAYRIIQESLTNVARHADPPDATVRIRAEGDSLVIEVVDEGEPHATPSATDASSNGIAGMTERASAVGGSLVAGPRPGHGFAVRATLPITSSIASGS